MVNEPSIFEPLKVYCKKVCRAQELGSRVLGQGHNRVRFKLCLKSCFNDNLLITEANFMKLHRKIKIKHNKNVLRISIRFPRSRSMPL